MSRTSLPPELVSVIHAGVDVPDVAVDSADLRTGSPARRGNGRPAGGRKGACLFFGAAQRVAAVHPEAEFLIAGAGPEEDNLRRLARELGLNRNLTFASNLYDFSSALTAMDIFCLPSLRQGLGTIILEAMALGRPVIATGVGGIYGLVRNNETGLVVPPSDSGALAERILELLNDPVRARAIGEAGRVLVREEFGVERMVAQTAALYREVLASERVATPTVVV